MNKSDRLQISIENFVKDYICPRCGNDLEVFISFCYDPACCGMFDRITCKSGYSGNCHWEIEGVFEDDRESLEELGKRIGAKRSTNQGQCCFCGDDHPGVCPDNPKMD